MRMRIILASTKRDILSWYSQLLVVILLTTFASTAFAQRERETYTTGPTLEIYGQVRIAGEGDPIRNAPVRLERFAGGLVEQMSTDSYGRFRFTGLARGNYTVRVVAEGFDSIQLNVDLQVIFKQYLLIELTRGTSNVATNRLRSSAVIDARVPQPARKEYEKARAAYADKKVKEAVAHLGRALFAYPDFFEAHLMLGTAYMDTKEWEKAETTFRRALEISPDSSAAMISLGEAYYRQKRYAEAQKHLVDGLQLDEKAWHGHFTLARLYWDQGEVTKAGPPLGKTLQLKPDFAPAHLLAGNIMLRLGQEQRALVEYEEYLRLEPKGEFAEQTKQLVHKINKLIAEKNK